MPPRTHRRRHAILACGVICAGAGLASGCFYNESGLPPPTNSFYYPTGLAVSPGRSVMYVANSDFDLQYNAGTVQALNLTALALGLHGAKPFADLHDRLMAVPLVLAGTWILAGLSYQWVFKPMQRFKPLLMPGRTPAWDPAPAAASVA